MDNASYLDVALRLANTELIGVEETRDALHEEPWWSERVTERDVRALRPVAAGLRKTLAAAVAADPAEVERAINVLLAAHPVRPRLSGGHEESGPHWHMHVADPHEPPA